MLQLHVQLGCVTKVLCMWSVNPNSDPPPVLTLLLAISQNPSLSSLTVTHRSQLKLQRPKQKSCCIIMSSLRAVKTVLTHWLCGWARTDLTHWQYRALTHWASQRAWRGETCRPRGSLSVTCLPHSSVTVHWSDPPRSTAFHSIIICFAIAAQLSSGSVAISCWRTSPFIATLICNSAKKNLWFLTTRQAAWYMISVLSVYVQDGPKNQTI